MLECAASFDAPDFRGTTDQTDYGLCDIDQCVMADFKENSANTKLFEDWRWFKKETNNSILKICFICLMATTT